MKAALKSSIAVVLILSLIGCPSQNTIADLANILGTSAASIAQLENQPGLAAKLTTDTAAAVSAIKVWKSGTPAQEAIQAINLVIGDLNLFPQTSQYAPLIILAATTAEAILAILQPPSASPAVKGRVSTPKVGLAPQNAKEFKQRWNALAPDSASRIK